MRHIQKIAAMAPLQPTKDRKELELYNIERVRSFVEKNPGCLLKTIYHSLNLHPRTVTKAIRIIEGES